MPTFKESEDYIFFEVFLFSKLHASCRCATHYPKAALSVDKLFFENLKFLENCFRNGKDNFLGQFIISSSNGWFLINFLNIHISQKIDQKTLEFFQIVELSALYITKWFFFVFHITKLSAECVWCVLEPNILIWVVESHATFHYEGNEDFHWAKFKILPKKFYCVIFFEDFCLKKNEM